MMTTDTTTTTIPALLPCPFCGAEAELLKTIDRHSNYPRHWLIQCENGCACAETDGLEPDDAIDAWNRRAAPAPAAAAPAAAQPVAWMCEDLILSGGKPLFTQVRERAERRADEMHEGKPAWRVTPLYAAAPAPDNPCLRKLRPDEPFFVLLGRDIHAAQATRHWADRREAQRGPSPKVDGARQIADQMDAYRGDGVSSASAPAAPEVVEALKGMMAAYPISTSVAQTDAIIKAHAALRSAGEAANG